MSTPSRTSTVRLLEQIGDDVSCPVCLMPFTNPKILFCRHEFCEKCLQRLVNGQVINCPQCRVDTSLPENGVAGLQPAFHLQTLMEVQCSLQQRVQETLTCDKHEDEKISLFCDPCKAPICSRCLTQHHNGHPCREVSYVCSEYKKELESELKKKEVVVQKIEKQVGAFQSREDEVVRQKEKLKARIQSMISQLQSALEAKESSLLNELETIATRKVDTLHQKEGEVKKFQVRLENAGLVCEALLADKNVKNVIANKEKCIQALTTVSSDFLESSIDPPEEANMDISEYLDSTLQSIEAFATVETCTVSPQKCYAKGNALSTACVEEPATATVYVMDKSTQPCGGCLSTINFDLTSEITGAVESGVAIKVKGNQYQLAYSPKVKGYHQLSIMIREQHIYNSPFRVAVKSTVSSIGPAIKQIAAVPSPSGLALDRNGDIFVVSEAKKRITVLSQSGKVIRETKDIDIFADIAVGDDGCIFAVNATEHQVVKLTSDGTPVNATVKSVDLLTGPLKFNAPRAVAFNSSNKRVYVSNTSNHEIQVLNADLSYWKTIGKEGTGRGQFKFPRGICCDSSGKVIVADSNNDRIQVFSADGKFIRAFGHPGDQPGHLKWPLGIATDASKNIYVSDSVNNRVSIFSANGSFLKCTGDKDVMKKPSGLAVDSTCGTLLVCNYDADSILVF